MAQFRPRRRSKPLSVQAVKGPDGNEIEVADSAVRALASWPSERVLVDRQSSPAQALAELDYDSICRAAVDAGASAPSKRTVRRWKHNDRIPDPVVADLVGRRSITERLGGIEKTAAALGRSKSAIYDWVAGRTGALRKDAQRRLDDALARLRLATSGIDPARTVPRITFTADVMVRHEGNADYDYRNRKNFILGPPDGQDAAKGNTMDPATVDDFAMAMAKDQHQQMLTILEAYCSTDVADFDMYDNSNGFHFESISRLRVQW